MSTEFEEAFDRFREEVSDYTEDELIDEWNRLTRVVSAPLDTEQRAKKEAIGVEAADRVFGDT